jgi:adenosylcobinamide kinase/adenosylcobinamide-phosphate guanylyltransferase
VTAVHHSHLVLGGARSGKSRYALDQAGPAGFVAFLATARALDAEMAARIARHRAERPARWSTIEAPLEVARAHRHRLRHDLGREPDGPWR